MAWFKKKKSPIDQRLEELDRQMAELEALARRQQQEAARAAQAQPAPDASRPSQPPAANRSAGPAAPPPKPRFRTTVTPKGVAPIHGIEPHEVDFFARKDKAVDFSLEAEERAASKPSSEPEKTELPSPTQNQIHDFIDWVLRRGVQPKEPHPKERLASYLTTGSFQRLKPLRYERRVARTRFAILALIVVVVLILLYKFITR